MNIPVVAQLSKAPVLGKVKTRMQPFLTEVQSLELHKWLTQENLQKLCENDAWHYHLWGDKEHLFFSNLLSKYTATWKEQASGDLGDKLLDISRSYEGIPSLFIGSDCPFIDTALVSETFYYLKCGADLVLIPAHDGGYVGLATVTHYPSLFDSIDWGTEKVAEQTLERAEALNLNVTVLPALADIDRPEDLALLKPLKTGLEFIP